MFNFHRMVENKKKRFEYRTQEGSLIHQFNVQVQNHLKGYL